MAPPDPDASESPRLSPSPTDALILGFLAGLAVVVSVAHPAPGPLLVVVAFLAAATLAAAAHTRQSPGAALVHDFLPVAVVIVLFELLGPVIPAVNPARWDHTFAAVDARVCPGLRDAWFGLLGRPGWLVDAAALAYVTYYAFPVVIAAALCRQGRRDDFREFALFVIGTLLASYAGYLLFPTAGPRLEPAAAIGGGALTRGVTTFVELAEGNQLDAFPSGHTAVSLATLALGWGFYPRWRALMVLVVGGIVFSTVYLSYHYVVDVVAGAALALGVLALRHWWPHPTREASRRAEPLTARRRTGASAHARA